MKIEKREYSYYMGGVPITHYVLINSVEYYRKFLFQEWGSFEKEYYGRALTGSFLRI